MPDPVASSPHPPAPTPEGLVCAAVVAAGRADGCGASLIPGSEDRLPLAATDETFLAAAELEFSVWEGPGPEVLDSGRPVVVTDVWAEHARWPLTTPRARALPLRAFAVLPLTAAGRPIGLFAAYRRAPRPFTTVDLAALDVFARAVAVLALDRFGDLADLPVSPISTAVGVLMERHRISADAALALLRARAYATDRTLTALAAALLEDRTTLDD